MKAVSVVLDSWFLIAILRRESNLYPETALNILSGIRKIKERGRLKHIYVLWPVYYETLSTRTVRDKSSIQRLRKFAREFRKELINADDTPFREECLYKIKTEEPELSLSDQVIGEFLLKLAEERPYEEIILVTDDEGFSRFVRYWRKTNIKVINALWEDIKYLFGCI
jgi:hypothetical protein